VTGNVVATHIWPIDAEEPLAVDPLELDFGGARGDRHYGETMPAGTRQSAVFTKGTTIRNHRQISIVDAAELATIADNMGLIELAPGVIADNICTSGIPNLTSLAPMSRLIFDGGAVIMVGGENLPCVISGRMISNHYGSKPEAFPKHAMGLRGVTGWVEHPGLVRPGTAITVRPYAP
jgi:MOSC domain-containing protein YiiM